MKNETLEEAAQRYSEDWENITGLEYENEYIEVINKLDFINGAKWQQERSYSEEDLKEAFGMNDKDWICFEEWFEQFNVLKNGTL